MKRPQALQENVMLGSLTSYQIGGAARFFFRPTTAESLKEILLWAKHENRPLFILGAGTNVLISDNGYRGVVVCMQNYLSGVGRPEPNGEWTVGAGAMLLPWVRRTAWLGLAGVESLLGIPGTIGGALKMNAGAFSQEISHSLIDIEVLGENLNFEILEADEIGFSYRAAPGLKDKIILKARFQFQQEDPEKLLKHAREIVTQRRSRQPLKWPSCGSVFKRPAGDYAGRLIENAGIKGYTSGGAQISEQHANFIINKQKASAKDVLNLIKMAKKRVKEEFGVVLEREVILLGFSEEELVGA